MRDVILKRKKKDVRIVDSGDALYTHNLSIPLTDVGKAFSFDRGYQWVDVRARQQAVPLHQHPPRVVQLRPCARRLQELLANAPASGRTNVFVCDCNSDPLNHTVKPTETQPHSGAVRPDHRRGGFTDEWLQWTPAARGLDLRALRARQRRDCGRVRPPHRHGLRTQGRGGGLAVDKGRVTGTKLSDRDPATGLWPSDHGGVVLRLRGL